MTHSPLYPNLALNRHFKNLDKGMEQVLEEHLSLVRLAEDEVLFQQGDAGDCLYVLIKGRIGVRMRDSQSNEIDIGEEFEPGTNIGEIALVTGQNRTVTVYARSDSQLVRLSKDGFDQLAEKYPQILADITKTMAPRWQRVQLARVLWELLGEIDSTILPDLQSKLEWQQLSHGELLFRQGDAGDAAYIVVNGRLRISVTLPDGSQRVVDESGPGDIVGEFALLTGDVRSATVKAIRETNLVKLTPSVFTSLIERYPHAMIQIARIIIDRHKQSLRFAPARHMGAINIALVPASLGVNMTEFIQRLKESSNALGQVLHLSSNQLDEIYGKKGAAQTPLDDPANPILSNWLSGLETQYQYIFYESDPTWTTWTRRCIRQADRILIIANSESNPTPGRVEKTMQSLGLTARTDLVLLHPADVTRPTGTRKWFRARELDSHRHVRINDQTHYQRLVRWLSGKPITMVLSGGAARGFAHLGVFRALEEAGVPIDQVGGTSMGALLGAGYAMGRDYRNMFELAKSFANPKNLFDYTLPYASLMTTKKITTMTKSVFGDLQIEDLWRPFFCVSSNLSQGEPLVHQGGLLWKSVRASIAIPGIFAPILYEGELLVDGGAINNFPVDIMRTRCEGGIIIGVNMSPAREMMEAYQFGSSISGWRVLWSRINPFIEPIDVPNLAANLIRSMEISSVYRIKTTETQADVLIQPEVEGYGMLDFDCYEPIIEIGYQAAKAQLAQIQNLIHATHVTRER
jgi:predicted acylesterase/phospholipase RssA/CRP-like cAMP-binding protein